MENPKSTIGTYDLPRGIVEEGKTIKQVQLREITGIEEDLLAEEKGTFTRKFNQVLVNCTVALHGDEGIVIDEPQRIQRILGDLSIGDRMFTLLSLRRVSLGDNFPFEVKCPSCSKKFGVSVNLSELKITGPNGNIKSLYEYDLPSGRKVTLKPMTGKDELANDNAINKGTKKDPLSLGILLRTEELDGKPPTMLDIKKLGIKDRNFIRNRFPEIEGNVETAIEVECHLCGEEFTTELDLSQRGFFFPLEE